MAKSFLLKDSGRRTGGYLQVRPDGIRCRVEGKDKVILLLYDNQDGESRLELQSDGTEQCFPAIDTELVGAVVIRGDALWLSTDDTARHMYRVKQEQIRMMIRKTMEETESQRQEEEKKKTENVAASGKEENSAKGAQPEKTELQHAAWPQRRWPPSPCCPHAVYQHGMWYVSDEDAAGLLL